MKNNLKRRSAFTLVELLVVIVIIALVATAVARAITGARRQARATKCQANLRNLHTAVVAYMADKGHYPHASSYEIYQTWFDKGGKKESFIEYRGWVSWIPEKGTRRDQDGKTPWQKEPSKSHAADFFYPTATDVRMREAIENGALFKYVGKDFSTFRCPEHMKTDGGDVHLAYAMNSWFYSHNCRAVNSRSAHDLAAIDSSRMALFIEQTDATSSSEKERTGQNGKEQVKQSVWEGDGCWESGWDPKNPPPVEVGRFGHRKTNKNYGHVVFVDGHVASICEDPQEYNEIANPDNAVSTIADVFERLGKGKY